MAIPNSKINEKPASRVTILDAVEFDNEIQRILKEKLLAVFHTISPSLSKWEPEFDALLRLVSWKLSMSQLHATFGQQLLKIKYSRDVTQRRVAAWAVINIVAPYLKQRSSEIASLLVQPSYRDQTVERISRVMGWMEVCGQVGSLLNLLVFLREGVYPTLADRLAGTRPVAAPSSATRVVGYSFMTRELLWHGFIELIVFVLPLINVASLQRRVRKLMGRRSHAPVGPEPLVFTTATRCAVCQQPPTLPYHMGCPHAFCYYCLQSSKMVDPKFECPSCGYSTDDPAVIQPVVSHFCTNS